MNALALHKCIFRAHLCTTVAALTCGIVSLRVFRGRVLLSVMKIT